MDERKIQLTYSTIPEGTVWVKIFDEKKFLLQSDRIVIRKAFSKKYDFSKIPTGKYHMEVYDQDGLVEQLALDLTEKKSEPLAYTKLEKVEEGKTENLSLKTVINLDIFTKWCIPVYHFWYIFNYRLQLEDVKGFQKLYVFNKINPKANLEFQVRSDRGFNELLAAR